MRFLWIYVTAGSREEATTIGREVVGARLAACANVVGGMESIYWWEGEIQEDEEVVLIFKTRETLLAELIEKVKSLHSYDTPCVVALPILDGHPDYLQWLADETEPAAS